MLQQNRGKKKTPLVLKFLKQLFSKTLLLLTQIDKIQESIDIINSRSKPLAIYAFTKDETLKREILAETSSGSVVFNDALIQVMRDFSYRVYFHINL